MTQGEVDDVIQIKEGGKTRKAFAGCFAVIRDVRSWGVIADIIGPGDNLGGPNEYPVRIPFDDFVIIGKKWTPR